MFSLKIELIIQNKDNIYIPCVPDSLSLQTDRRGSPGKLTFTVIQDDKMTFTEGNAVRLSVDGAKVFYGYIFTQKRDKQQLITITAYDQLRYMLNKDTYVYTNKTASDVIKMVAEDFNLKLGTIDKTSFIISSRTELNMTLFDIVYNAIDLELTNKKKLYVLYDDCGNLTLKSIDNMKVDILIDEETGENFDYSSSIDDQTYNKIKLSYENSATGKRDIYVSQDGKNINEWGILQYFGELQEEENGDTKSQALLELYNAKTRKLKLTNVFGDFRVRGGCMIPVMLNLGDVSVKNYMLVEKCTHKVKQDEHFMDLHLRGGEFVG